MSARAKVLYAIVVTTCFAGLVMPASAGTIKLMVGGLEKQIYLPFKLTEQLGYFKDEGLTVELLNEPSGDAASGVDAEDEMLAGAVQGVGGFYDHCVDLQSKGKFVESVVQINQVPGEVELVSTKHPEIKAFADMKGKALGVTGLRSSTNFLTQYLATKAGVPLGDFTSVPVGAGTNFIAAMRHDQIQAGMTTEPTITRLLKTDEAKVLVDMRTMQGTKAALGGVYPATSLYMPTDWVNAHKADVQKLANALVKTLRWIQAHTSTEIADKMPKDYLVGDRDGYIAALEGGRGMYSPDGVMPAGGPETVLAVLSGFSTNLKGKTVDLSKTFTTEFVKNVM
jgi:NitT/TauT family transport system substrate-binding protein